MKTLYQPLHRILALAMVVFITTGAQAQEGSYASLTKHTGKAVFTDNNSNVIEPVIKIKGRTERQILLTWSPIEGAVSHYVLERSTDGRIFHDAGLLFTGDWENEPDYYYTDKFRKPYLGPLFYRLKVVGLEGSVIYTPATVLNPAGA